MQYKALFQINFHHGYFLDNGQHKFLPTANNTFVMSDSDKVEALKHYDFSNFLKVVPTQKTAKILKNYRMMLRLDKQGFRVLLSTQEKTRNKYSPIITIEDNLTLSFELKATDSHFYNYTQSVSLTNNRMYLFTNKKPVDEAANFENVFKRKGGFIDRSFLLKEDTTRALIETISVEDEFVSEQFSISNCINLIQTDNSLNDEEKTLRINEFLNQIIQKRKKKGLIGYVRLSIKGDGSEQHLLKFQGANQYTKNSHPEFTFSFLNRKTFWRFISASNGAILTTKNKLWSSKNGFVEISDSDFNPAGLDPPDTDPTAYKFPNPTADLIKKENNKYYSEVFI